MQHAPILLTASQAERWRCEPYCKAVRGLRSGENVSLLLARRDTGGIALRRLRLVLP